jgi:hypothetical protein
MRCFYPNMMDRLESGRVKDKAYAHHGKETEE